MRVEDWLASVGTLTPEQVHEATIKNTSWRFLTVYGKSVWLACVYKPLPRKGG